MFPAEALYMETHVLHFLQLAPTGSSSVLNSMKLVGNPVQTCDRVYALIQSLTSQIRTRLEDPKSAGKRWGMNV